MNKNLVELDNNNGLSIDEDGNVTTITKNKEDYEFKEILEKENKLELLNDDMNLLSKKYEEANYDLKWSRIFNIITLIGALLAGVISFRAISLGKNIELCIITGCLIKFASFASYGTTIGNKKKIKRITNKIRKIEDKISILTRELNNIKEKVNYKTLSNTKSDLTLTSNYQNVDNREYDNKSIGKVKVLKLTKSNK